MTAIRRSRLAAEAGAFVALLAALVVWQACAARRQARLDAALIAACIRHDNAAAARLLDQGANPNAHLVPDMPRPIWSVLIDRLRGRKPPANTSDTALLVILDSLVKRPRSACNAVVENVPLEDPELVKLLLDRGADIEARNEIGETTLLQATGWDYSETTMLVLARRANVNVEYGGGRTALMEAATRGNTRIVLELLNRGAQTEARDCLGMTALMWAAGFGRIIPDVGGRFRWDEGATRALLQHDAKVNPKDQNGQTALKMARARGAHNREIIRLLKQAGAKE